MTKQIYEVVVHTGLSFLSLCVCFSPSLVCAYIENKHTRRVFLINLAIFVVLSTLMFSVAVLVKPIPYSG